MKVLLFESFIHITLYYGTVPSVIVPWQQELSVVTRLTTRQGTKPCYVQAKSSPPWKHSRQWLSIIFPSWTQNTCLQFSMKTQSCWTGCGHKVSGYKCLIWRASDEHYYPLLTIPPCPFTINAYKCQLSTSNPLLTITPCPLTIHL